MRHAEIIDWIGPSQHQILLGAGKALDGTPTWFIGNVKEVSSLPDYIRVERLLQVRDEMRPALCYALEQLDGVVLSRPGGTLWDEIAFDDLLEPHIRFRFPTGFGHDTIIGEAKTPDEKAPVIFMARAFFDGPDGVTYIRDEVIIPTEEVRARLVRGLTKK